MSAELSLTAAELRAIAAIALSSGQTPTSLVQRLAQLTWRDGLAEFRMQSSTGLLPWMQELLALSDRVNQRLEREGIPLGPSSAAYQAWLGRR